MAGCGKPVAGRGVCNTHYQRLRKHGSPLVSLYQTDKGHLCAIEDCERAAERRGWCRMHYARFERHGDPRVVLRIRGDDETRFWSYVHKDGPGGCWLWTGALSDDGYGQFQLGCRRVIAHRFAYELCVGPIPDGLHIDHVYANGCRYRNCVNPNHLEPVTPKENTRRLIAARSIRIE